MAGIYKFSKFVRLVHAGGSIYMLATSIMHESWQSSIITEIKPADKSLNNLKEDRPLAREVVPIQE